MATIGQQLTAPEAGWKRYDDSSPSFKYIGTYRTSDNGNTSAYNGTYHDTSDRYAKITFDFIGTKIRIISTRNKDHTYGVKITIDGVSEVYSENGAFQYFTLLYEKTGLPNARHTVTIERNGIDTAYFSLDAIDIDFTGRLLHPDEVLDPKDLATGKRIRCHYQAPISGQVGVFSGLGQETSDFIPPASSATPNGDFYWICIDRDYLGRWKLIADRNIQHSISWDTINSEGMTNTGREINL